MNSHTKKNVLQPSSFNLQMDQFISDFQSSCVKDAGSGITQQQRQMRQHQLDQRVRQRMREPDVERRIQQRQKELLQMLQQQAEGTSTPIPTTSLRYETLEKVKRLYRAQQAQQGRREMLQPVWDEIEQEVRSEVEQEAQFVALLHQQ